MHSIVLALSEGLIEVFELTKEADMDFSLKSLLNWLKFFKSALLPWLVILLASFFEEVKQNSSI